MSFDNTASQERATSLPTSRAVNDLFQEVDIQPCTEIMGWQPITHAN